MLPVLLSFFNIKTPSISNVLFYVGTNSPAFCGYTMEKFCSMPIYWHVVKQFFCLISRANVVLESLKSRIGQSCLLQHFLWKTGSHTRHAARSTALVQTWMDQSETLLLFFAETNQTQSCSRVPQSSWSLSSSCAEELWVEIGRPRSKAPFYKLTTQRPNGCRFARNPNHPKQFEILIMLKILGTVFIIFVTPFKPILFAQIPK